MRIAYSGKWDDNEADVRDWAEDLMGTDFSTAITAIAVLIEAHLKNHPEDLDDFVDALVKDNSYGHRLVEEK